MLGVQSLSSSSPLSWVMTNEGFLRAQHRIAVRNPSPACAVVFSPRAGRRGSLEVEALPWSFPLSRGRQARKLAGIPQWIATRSPSPRLRGEGGAKRWMRGASEASCCCLCLVLAFEDQKHARCARAPHPPIRAPSPRERGEGGVGRSVAVFVIPACGEKGSRLQSLPSAAFGALPKPPSACAASQVNTVYAATFCASAFGSILSRVSSALWCRSK